MQWPCLLNSFWMHLIVWNRTSFIIITHLVLTVFVNIVVTYLRIKRLSFHQLTLALLMGSTSLDQLAYNFLLRVCPNQAGFIVLAASIVCLRLATITLSSPVWRSLGVTKQSWLCLYFMLYQCVNLSTHSLASSRLLKPSVGQLGWYLHVLNNDFANGLSLLTRGLL